jgi:hypothetical protein
MAHYFDHQSATLITGDAQFAAMQHRPLPAGAVELHGVLLNSHQCLHDPWSAPCSHETAQADW